MEVQIVPSLLSVEEDQRIKVAKKLAKSFSIIQIDVMDGKFVPDHQFSPKFIEKLPKKLHKEVHLMVKHPELHIPKYLKAGAQTIIFHIETTKDPLSLIKMVKRSKQKVGIAISPKTPIQKIIPLLPRIDKVLVMSVHPGKGGQKFMNKSLDKVRALRRINKEILIEIDGGVKKNTVRRAVSAGVNHIVVGSALVKGDLRKNIKEFKQFNHKGTRQCKIYVFRHGQSHYNKLHKFTGWKDSTLTPQGFKDANKVAMLLKDKHIDVMIHSRLTRSIQTMNEVMKFHPECYEITVDDRMIERSYGQLEGHSHTTFVREAGEKDYYAMRHWHKVDHLHGKERKEWILDHGRTDLHTIRRSHTIRPPGGESVIMVEKRVWKFLKDLKKRMKKEQINVAISAHGNSIRAFRKFMENLSVKEEMRLENPWDDYFEYTIEC